MEKSMWLMTCVLLATAPQMGDWTVDGICMMVGGFASALTQWRLVVDKKISTWTVIPLEIVMGAVCGFIVHALLYTSVDDLRKMLVYVFGVSFAGTPGLRYALRNVLPQLYGAKNGTTDS